MGRNDDPKRRSELGVGGREPGVCQRDFDGLPGGGRGGGAGDGGQPGVERAASARGAGRELYRHHGSKPRQIAFFGAIRSNPAWVFDELRVTAYVQVNDSWEVLQAATAFLHSIMIQENRGMLKIWNMSLVLLTFLVTMNALAVLLRKKFERRW